MSLRNQGDRLCLSFELRQSLDYINISIVIIFSCLLSSPPFKEGVDSVLPKETRDEVVLPLKCFTLPDLNPIGFKSTFP